MEENSKEQVSFNLMAAWNGKTLQWKDVILNSKCVVMTFINNMLHFSKMNTSLLWKMVLSIKTIISKHIYY